MPRLKGRGIRSRILCCLHNSLGRRATWFQSLREAEELLELGRGCRNRKRTKARIQERRAARSGRKSPRPSIRWLHSLQRRPRSTLLRPDPGKRRLSCRRNSTPSGSAVLVHGRAPLEPESLHPADQPIGQVQAPSDPGSKDRARQRRVEQRDPIHPVLRDDVSEERVVEVNR